MFLLIRPLLIKFAQSEQVKRLIVDILKKLAKSTDNSLDDAAVVMVERALFG